MERVRIHPFFIVLCALMIIFGKAALLFATLTAVICHEFAHWMLAGHRGYRLTSVNLMPYGAVMGMDSGLSDGDLFVVSAAGPAANILIAFIIIALWWIFPSSYRYTRTLCNANLAIGIFNLLPLYPLDGARMVLAVSKNKTKCLKILRAFSLVCASLSAVLFIISAFYKIAYSLAVVSVMLYIGNVFDAENEKYILLCRQCFLLKNYSKPVEKKEIYINRSTKIGALLRVLNGEYYYSVHITDGNFRVLKTLENRELENLFSLEKNLPAAVLLSARDRSEARGA